MVRIELEWQTEAGFRAVAVLLRHECLAWRCGYVEIPKEHPLARDDPIIFDLAFEVHGGITFSAPGEEGHPMPSDGWWIGFDCAHAGDAPVEAPEDFPKYGKERTLEYVMEQCEKLAQQLKQFWEDYKELGDAAFAKWHY